MTDLRVCSVEVAPIRAEPDESSEQVTQALRGEPLTVEEEQDGWARVRTAYDYPGWVLLEDLVPSGGPGPGCMAPGATSRGRPGRRGALRTSARRTSGAG